jgi:dodecin
MISTRIAILPPETDRQRYQRSAAEVGGLVTKVIEVIGSSTESSDDAVRQALTAAARSVRGIRKIEVVSTSCEVTDGQVSRWDVPVKMQFPVEPR